eukprot:scaffold33192_cov16-Tisochrysis_lutea.AAC.2
MACREELVPRTPAPNSEDLHHSMIFCGACSRNEEDDQVGKQGLEAPIRHMLAGHTLKEQKNSVGNGNSRSIY